LPTLIEIDLTGGDVALTEEQSAHERIRFTGTLPSDTVVTVLAGPAKGWVKSFVNATTTGGHTVTVKVGTGATVATVPKTTPATAKLLFADDNNVLEHA
jgi:hypothetical protein